MIAPILTYLLSNAGSLRTKYLVMFSLTSIVSGYPLVFIDRFFDMYLTIPDYGSIFIVGLYLNFSEKIRKNKFSIFAFYAFSILFYENLAIALALAELMDNKKLIKDRIWLFILGLLTTCAWLATIITVSYFKSGSQNITFADDKLFRDSNFSHIHLLISAFTVLMLWPIVLGLLTSGQKKIQDSHLNLDENNLRFAFGLLATYLLAVFTSGLDAEGARQTISAQLLLYAIFSKGKKTINRANRPNV
jgi:hypothetical protein